MIILAIDTSASEGSITLSIDGQLTGPVHFGMEDSHLVSIGSTVDSLLKGQGVDIGDVGRIALVSGPGSFTGLRIGMAFAKGVHAALGTEVVTISSLELLACSLMKDHDLVCPMIDARKEEVYTALYRPLEKSLEEIPESKTQAGMKQAEIIEVLISPRVISPSTFLEELESGTAFENGSLNTDILSKTPILFVGTGAVRYRGCLSSSAVAKPVFIAGEANTVSTPTLARMAEILFPLRAAEIPTLEPYYIRASDAELKRLKVHRSHGSS